MLTFNKRIIDHELKNYFQVDKPQTKELILTLVQVLQYFIKDLPDDIHLKKPLEQNQELYTLLNKLPSSWLVDKETMRSHLMKLIDSTESEDTLFEAYKSLFL